MKLKTLMNNLKIYNENQDVVAGDIEDKFGDNPIAITNVVERNGKVFLIIDY